MPWFRSLTLLLLVSVPVLAEDWPQWLGPRRDGSSMEKIKPWKGDLKVLWRNAVSAGHSSPVIAGGKVYLFTRVKDKQAEQLTAYDAKTGKPLWDTPYPRAFFASPFGTGPQATPVVAGGRVYTFGATGVLACFDAEKGSLKWQVDTLKKFGAKNLFFGMACSPLVEGDRVIVNVGGPKDASVVAFNKDNGEKVWGSLNDRPSYSSGIALGKGKERQVVFLTAKGVRSLNPTDGKLFWEVPLVDKLSESSMTPVRVGDVLLASSVTFGMMGLQLSTKDDKPAAKQIWTNKTLTCYFSTPIPVGKDHVYMVTGVASLLKTVTSTLRCVEVKTGKELWNKPKIGRYHAAMLRTADDKLLLLSDLGNLILLDPDPKQYRELARSKVGKGEQIWAHPAVSDGRLYLRDEKELICLQLPE
jgi:glucose dehydrogenase